MESLNGYLNFGPDGWNKWNNCGSLFKCDDGFCGYRLAGSVNIPLAASAPRVARRAKLKKINENWYGVRGEITLIGDGEPDQVLRGMVWGTPRAFIDMGYLDAITGELIYNKTK